MTATARTPARPRRAFAHTAVVTRRNLLATVRLPDVLVLSTIQPVTFMLMFLYVFGGAIQHTLPTAASGRYINWLVPGILAQSAVFGATPTAFGLNTDRASGVIDRFRSLPMARSAVLAGRTTADLALSVISCVVMAGAGLAIGWRINHGILPALAAFGLLLLLGFAMAWVGVLIGLLIRDAESVNTVTFAVLMPLTFLSTAFIPPSHLPGRPAHHRAPGPPPRSRPCPHRPRRTADTAPACLPPARTEMPARTPPAEPRDDLRA